MFLKYICSPLHLQCSFIYQKKSRHLIRNLPCQSCQAKERCHYWTTNDSLIKGHAFSFWEALTLMAGFINAVMRVIYSTSGPMWELSLLAREERLLSESLSPYWICIGAGTAENHASRHKWDWLNNLHIQCNLWGPSFHRWNGINPTTTTKSNVMI